MGPYWLTPLGLRHLHRCRRGILLRSVCWTLKGFTGRGNSFDEYIMSSFSITDDKFDTKLPRSFACSILLICVAPILLNLLGIDFGSIRDTTGPLEIFAIAGGNLGDVQFHVLSGAFVHTLLEWTAFCIAAFVAFLAFNHYKITRDVTTPIIGVAFFMAGVMDAFHTLAADRLISAVADNNDLVPFTWAICRVFNALIMLAGVIILLLRNQEKKRDDGARFIFIITILFGLIAYAIIFASASSSKLPVTTFPDALLTRPYDAVPLLLFTISGLFIYPLLYKRYPSLFSYALILSAIPQVATQLHMTFGSTALFDNHFNIAHFLKIVAYGVPLMGLSMDYVQTHKRLKESESRQRSIMDASPEMIYLVDPLTMRFLYVNRMAIEKSGMTLENLLLKGPQELLQVGYEKLERLYEAAIAAGENGTVVELPMDTGDEIFSLFEVRLRAVQMEGRWVIMTIAQDISLRKHAEQKLRDTHEELERRVQERTQQLQLEIEQREKASNAKNEFLASMSHELRTPMNSILGFAQLLELSGTELSNNQKHHVSQILSSGEHLLNLVTDLLDLNTIEERGMALKFENVSANQLIEDCLATVELKAQERNIHIIDECGSQLSGPWLWSDATRLKQVLLNLLSNAIKYNRQGGSVTISYSELPHDMLRIIVADTGQGIGTDVREKLFLPFERLGREAGPVEGSGIGLTIAKRIIEMLNGKIDFESTQGRGSTFWIDIPLGQAQELTDPAVAIEAEPEISTSCSEESTSKVLLYVEDNPANMTLMKHVLTDFPNIKMLSACTAELGIALAVKHHPDLIVMDINLPGLNGIQALQVLKQKQETQAIPVIAVSADAMPQNIDAALQAGFEAYVTKPINVPEIQQAISGILAL